MAYLIVLLLIIAFALRVDFVFYILYVCIGLYLWGRWYTPRALANLRVERIFHSHAFWGERLPITLQISNQNRLAVPWLQLQESVALELRGNETTAHVLTLPGKETAVIHYTIYARRRGYYKLGPLQIITGDLFGLYQERHGRVDPSYFTVYPRLIPLSQLGLPSRLPFGTIASPQRLFADPARPAGVRNYVSGDSLRQINWKASAHTRHLLVKTYQPAISLETAVLLNLNQDEYQRRTRLDTIEWAIEVAASLAAHLIEQRQAVGFITNGADPLHGAEDGDFDEASGRLQSKQLTAAMAPAPISPRPGRGQLMRILERLARLEAIPTAPFAEWTPQACHNLSWGTTLLVVTTSGDEAVCQALHRLVRVGLNPVLITVEPAANFGEVRQRAKQLGFAAYEVLREEDLDKWRRPLGVTSSR
ncbi:MAG: DUF58 domain-containing protein [Ardenticatenaceae bacterium]|nr:DUF58 domain-containing protein [Ardenticatenaceae bacterium]